MNKDLIAYCGLYCEDCFGYQGRIADMLKNLGILKKAGTDSFLEKKRYW